MCNRISLVTLLVLASTLLALGSKPAVGVHSSADIADEVLGLPLLGGEETALLARLRRQLSAIALTLGAPRKHTRREHDRSLWHSYQFGYGANNRDKLTVTEVRRAAGFAGSQFAVTRWVTDPHTRGVALGLAPRALVICRFPAAKPSDPDCFQTETPGKPITASIFSKRNLTTRTREVYVICAMSDGSVTTLQWFAVRSTTLDEVSSPWPLLHTPTSLLVFSAGGHTKLLALNAWQPQNPHNTADVYDFQVDTSVDLWLSHKVQLKQADNAAISYVGDQVYLSVSQEGKYINFYEFKDQKFELVIKFPSEGVKEIITFDIGYTSFLAVSGSVPRVLRVPPNKRDAVDGLQFANSSVVRRWLSVPVNTYRDEVLLLAETERGVEIVTWSAPARFAVDTSRPPHCVIAERLPVVPDLECLTGRGLAGTAGLMVGDSAALLLPATTAPPGSQDREPASLLLAAVRLDHLPSPAQLERQKIMAKKDAIQSLQSSQESTIQESKRRLLYSLRQNGSSIVSAPWTVEHMFTRTSKVSKELVADQLEVAGQPWTSEDWPALTNAVMESKEGMYARRKRIEQLYSTLEDAVSIDDKGDLKVTSSQKLQGSIIVGGKTVINSAQLTYLNGFPVYDLIENTVRLGLPQTIGGHKRLTKLNVEDLYVTETVNKRKVSPYASSDKPIEVHGDVQVTQPLLITGSLRAVEPSNDHQRSAYPGSVSSPKYPLLDVESVAVAGYLNDRPASLVSEELAAKQPALSQLTVRGTMRVSKNLHVSTINGVDINKLAARSVPLYANQPVHIPGDTFIKSCRMHDVSVSVLNELQFPADYIVRGGTADVWGYKSFSAPLTVGRLEVSSTVDSVPVSELVTLDTDQQLKGLWAMKNLRVLGNLQMATVFEPVLPHPIESSELMTHTSQVVFRHLVVAGNVTAAHPGWRDWLADVVYQDDPIQVVTAPKHFKEEIKVNDIFVTGLLNEINITEFITVNTFQSIPGNKSLRGAVEMGRLDVQGRCLGVNLRSLARDAVRLSGSQTGLAELSFTQPLTVGSGLHTEKINGFIDATQIVTLNTNQVIVGSVSFERLQGNHCTVYGNVNSSSNIVNGKNFPEVDANRLSLSRDQVITGSWSTSHAKVRGKCDVNQVNDIDLRNLHGEALNSRIPELDFIHIKEMHIIGNVKTSTINKFNLSDIANDAIWVDSENVITGKLVIKGELSAESIKLTGKLNSDFLESYTSDIVMKAETDIDFTGHKTFVNGAHFRNIQTDFVNGRKMKDVLTISSKQEISGPVQFVGNVEFLDNSYVLNLNGLNTDIWNNIYSYSDGHHIINGDLKFKDSFVTKDLDISQTLVGYNVEDFFSSLVWLNDDALIESSKIFTKKVVFEKNLEISETVNGVDLSQFLEEVVLIDHPAEVKGTVVFTKDVFADAGLFVMEDLQLLWLQGCSLKEWANEAVYLDKQSSILGSKYFESISSNGPINTKFLNNIDMDRIILLHVPQFITEVLTFSQVSSANDISVGGLCNNLRLDKEWENTLLTEGDQNVVSPKMFQGDVTVRRELITYDSINGYPLKNIVTLDTDQRIYGPKMLHNVEVKSNVRVLGPVSGQDLGVWREKVILKDSPNVVVRGRWNVQGNVTFLGSVIAAGTSLLDRVHLPSLAAAQESRKQQAELDKAMVFRDKRSFCQSINDLLDVASKQTFIFKYLERVQFLPTSHPVIGYLHFKLGSDDLLAVSLEGVCEGLLLLWDAEHTQFLPVLTPTIGEVSSWAVLPASESGDILLVSAGGPSGCRHSGGNLWLAQRTQPVKFLHVETLGNWTQVETSPWNQNIIYAVDINGNLNEWKYEPKSGLVHIHNWGTISSGHISIIPAGEKSLANSTEVKSAGLEGLALQGREMHSFSLETQSAKTNYTLSTSRQEALVPGKHDDIMIYEGNPSDGKLFHRLPTTSPGLVRSIQFGASRETFIVFIENKNQLQLYKYQGVSGFTPDGSVRLPGARLLGVERLPTRNLLAPHIFVLVATPQPSPGIFVLEMSMFGDPISTFAMPDTCSQEDY